MEKGGAEVSFNRNIQSIENGSRLTGGRNREKAVGQRAHAAQGKKREEKLFLLVVHEEYASGKKDLSPLRSWYVHLKYPINDVPILVRYLDSFSADIYLLCGPPYNFHCPLKTTFFIQFLVMYWVP